MANKYRAKPEVVDGIRFDSAAEARRYRELKLMERAKEIHSIEIKPVFPLTCGGRPVLIRSDGYPNGRKAKYTADFAYICNRSDERVIEEVKGFDQADSRLRRAIVEAEYGVRIRVVKPSRRK